MVQHGGISTEGDVLVSHSADNVDLNFIWSQIQEALAVFNKHRSTIAGLLSYTTTNVADAIPQSLSEDSFEEVSELGVAHSVREPATALPLGYGFKDFDLRITTSWKFLRGATAEQIKAVANRMFAADNKLVNGSVMKRLFSPNLEANEYGQTIFGLWSNDGIASPPPYLGKEFPANTTHYLTSGADTIDSQDVEGLIRLVADKGYGRSTGSQLLILANPVEAEFISTFRAGVESRPGGPMAKYDFVRSQTAPPFYSNTTLVGQPPPGEYSGLPVEGQYGPAWLIQSHYIPAGYVAVVASSGQNSQNNPVAIRVHPNKAYQGLRLIPGNGPFPIQESFAIRSFGTGVRHRGAAAVVQVTTDPTYSPPTFQL